MTGIMLEAVLMESAVTLLGRSLPGYLLGGALAVSSALLHKIITLLFLYGFDLVRLLVFMYKYALKMLNLKETQVDPVWLVILFVLLYFLTGSIAAVTGYVIGNRVQRKREKSDVVLSPEQPSGFSFSPGKGYSLVWLFVHIFFLSFLLWVISAYPLYLSTPVVFGYVGVCLWRYRRAVRHLRKPWFWIQVVGITLLASLVWKGLETGDYFSREGLVIGLRMNLRAVMVMVSFSAISVEFRNPVVRLLLFRRGFANLYLSTGLAFSSFPHVMERFPGARDLFRRPVSVLTESLASAGDLYERFAGKKERQPAIFLVTGAVGAGKTSFLQTLAEELKKKGIPVAGFLAQGVVEDGRKKGYRLLDLASGESRPFGEVRNRRGRIHTGRFTFNRETLRWGEDLLWQAVSDERNAVIIVDEVGPLELKGKGWAPALERLLRESDHPQVWSVRSRSREAVMKAWNFRPAAVIEVTGQTPGDLVRLLEREVREKENPSL
jgi:nucleoside-triphosphatase THEP1